MRNPPEDLTPMPFVAVDNSSYWWQKWSEWTWHFRVWQFSLPLLTRGSDIESHVRGGYSTTPNCVKFIVEIFSWLFLFISGCVTTLSTVDVCPTKSEFTFSLLLHFHTFKVYVCLPVVIWSGSTIYQFQSPMTNFWVSGFSFSVQCPGARYFQGTVGFGAKWPRSDLEHRDEEAIAWSSHNWAGVICQVPCYQSPGLIHSCSKDSIGLPRAGR